MRTEFLDQVEELLHPRGLRNVSIVTRRKRHFSVFLAGISCKGDRSYFLEARCGPESAYELVAIDARHTNIRNNHLRHEIRCQCQCLKSARSGADFATVGVKPGREHIERISGVFHNQEAQVELVLLGHSARALAPIEPRFRMSGARLNTRACCIDRYSLWPDGLPVRARISVASLSRFTCALIPEQRRWE